MFSAFSGRSVNGLTLRRLARLRFVSRLAIAQIAFLPFLSYDLRAQPITANQIVTDGRTATSVQTSGNVTSVTTSTVSGANAFNSFSQFGVGQGNTVNLYTPNGAQNLINIVRDAPAYVNGTLNSYANGKIGGNVYFADPYGFVVGKSGTVNVGSLNVSTPSKEFTEGIIGPQGQINGGAVSNLMNGSFPISPDGNIRILGRINAEDGVRLTGQNVVIGGAGMNQRERVNADHAVKFAASVNSKGLHSASAISVRNGSIHIGAVNNATISGRLSARSRTTTPSTITVDAGKNITLGKTASLNTAGKTGDAGNITLKTQGDLTVKSGARIDASSAKGNGGIVDLSADGKFDIGDKVQINLAAPNGTHGTLVLDPVDIIIGGPGDANVNMSNVTVAAAIAALNGTGTFTLSASNSITIDPNGRVDGGTTVSVTLSAPTLTLLAGSYLRGDTVALDSGVSGTININAAANGGAQVLVNTGLQFTAAHLLLTSTATAIVGDGTTSTNKNAAGFISNATIARYAIAMDGAGDLTVNAVSSITVDATGLVDTRTISGGLSTASSLDVTLKAPAISVLSGGQILTKAINDSDSTFTTGDITLDATGSPSGTVSVAGKLDGGVTTLQAGSSVTLAATGIIDTGIRDGDGIATTNAQNVSLIAPTINAAQGSQILAGAVNADNATTFIGGNVWFDATSISTGTANAFGTIVGANVDLWAGATVNVGAQARIGSSLPSGTAAITLQAPNILVATGALFTAPAVNDGDPVSGAAVKYNLQAALAINSPSSNTIVQQYIAALNGSGSMTLSSTVSLAVGSLGVVNGGNLDVTLNAPSITLSGGSSVSGHTVKLLAGNDLNIDASRTGGAQISSATALQLAAVTLNLTNSAANVVVGDVALDAGVNLTNSTIANYLAAGPVQNFKISGSSSITVDAAGVIDVRHQTAGLTTGTSANIVLAAPTITIAAGAIVRADVVNIPVQDPAITDPQVPPPTFYTAGDITLTSSNITVGAGTLNGGVVTFNDGQSAIYVGPSNDPNAANSGFLSNAKIASYLASLGGTSTFGLSASSTISIDNGAIVAGGTARNLSFIAPTLTFAANSNVSGHGIILNAGAAGVININAASNGGAQIAAQTPLQVTAAQINLTSAAAMIVGNASTSTSTAAAGFVSNTTIANYVTALHGIGTLQLSAANSITVDGTGVVDGTKMTSNLSTGNSVNLLLTAPSITVAALGKVVALAVNTASTHYSSGSVTLNAAGSGSGLVSVAGTVKGGIVLLNSNLITVANGATFSAGAHGTVIFAFDEDLTVNSTSGSNGTGGILSNNVVATYVAAMSAGTFALSAGTHNLTLAANAIITAGNGIAVGLSGNTINVVTGATINAVTVGFGFNQDNVVIAASDPHIADTGFVSNSQIAALVLASANATTLTISANNSITVSAAGVIDTRFLNAQLHSTHNALNVELDAPIITIATGGQILAKAINSGTSWTDGNVTLSAVSSTSILAGLASSTTSITVDGTITGGNISIAANSTASSNFTSSVGGDLASVAEVIGSLVLGVNAGYVAGESHATVAINSHANISGSGNISITATGSETAADPVVALGIISPVGATAVVGSVKARISATVASGATIAAGGSLAVSAKNDTTLDISALTFTTAASFVTAVAVGMADIQTQAIVNSGAHISAGAGGVSVTARNTNEFSVSATAFAYSPAVGSGGVGGAVAYSTINTVATALLGADVGSSGALSAGPVQVAASSDTSKNAVSSSVTLGQPNLIGGIVTFIASKGEAIGDLVGFLLRPLVTIEFPLKTAGSLSLVISNQSANAGIAATGGGTAPAIYTAGDVSVVTTLIDDQIRDNSASSVTVGNPSTPEAATIAAAVAYGSYTHNSNAYVGQNVIITASRIGVSADTRLPNTNTWGQWDGLSETLSHLNANLGAVNNVVTTYADATASGGTKASVSGSFAYFGNTDNTTAWVGSGATLSSTRSTPGSWSSVVTYSDSSTLTVNFASDIAVAATATNNSINIGGVFGPLLLPGSDSGGLAAGGSLNLIISSSNTIAGVSNGATLTAKDVAVTATTTDLMFAIAPSSGSSSGSVALNGLTSLAFINNETHASISSGATVTAPTINVDAYQNISVLSLAGAIQISTTSGVGLALAYLQVDTDTSAFIGDNHTDIATFAGDDAGAQSAVNGVITSSALSVIAASVGRLTVASVAVVESDPFAEVGAASKAKAVIAGSTGALGTSPTSLLNRAAAAAAQKSGKPPSFSIDIAGSSAVSQTGVDTSAYISGVTINPSNPYAFGTAPFVQVQALNSSIMDNGSGAAALNLAGSDKPSAAVSGAISVAISQNATTAYISNTTISDQANATVMALNGGSQSVVAIGIAVTKSGLAGTIAASVALIADSATAYIDNSHVTGVAGGSSNALNVNAYQTSNIQIGGGSLYVSGGSASIGLSLTYAEIRDPGGSKAVDAHITNS